jgi:hypothetical protein
MFILSYYQEIPQLGICKVFFGLLNHLGSNFTMLGTPQPRTSNILDESLDTFSIYSSKSCIFTIAIIFANSVEFVIKLNQRNKELFHFSLEETIIDNKATQFNSSGIRPRPKIRLYYLLDIPSPFPEVVNPISYFSSLVFKKSQTEIFSKVFHFINHRLNAKHLYPGLKLINGLNLTKLDIGNSLKDIIQTFGGYFYLDYADSNKAYHTKTKFSINDKDYILNYFV